MKIIIGVMQTSEMATIRNGNHQKWQPSEMSTIRNGNHQKWQPSEMLYTELKYYTLPCL